MFNNRKFICLLAFFPIFMNKNVLMTLFLERKFNYNVDLISNTKVWSWTFVAVQGWWSGRVGFYHLSFVNIFCHSVDHIINICQKIHQCALSFMLFHLSMQLSITALQMSFHPNPKIQISYFKLRWIVKMEIKYIRFILDFK